MPRKTPVSEIPETPPRLCAKVHLFPSWAIFLSRRVLEKERLENLSRNIPSIASACVTWQNFPNANPLKDSHRLFFWGLETVCIFHQSLKISGTLKQVKQSQLSWATKTQDSACCQYLEQQLSQSGFIQPGVAVAASPLIQQRATCLPYPDAKHRGPPGWTDEHMLRRDAAADAGKAS